jgi:hypothetical protein
MYIIAIYKVTKSSKFDIRPVWSRDFIESPGRKKALGPETHEESQGHPGHPDHYWHPALFGKECNTFHNR